MGAVLYTIGVETYYLLVWFGSLFNQKAKLWMKGRRIRPKNKEGLKNTILVHCSSYGEYEQAAYFIRKYSENYPKRDILLSFFSPSGFEKIELPEYIAKKIYLPRDRSSNFEYLINEFDIKELILVKYELWPNMLKILNDKGVKLHLVSARFYERHFVFSSYAKWVRKLLRSFESIHLIDEFSYNKLMSYGFKNLYLSGDTRFDRVLEIAQTEIKIEFSFSENKPILVFGSVWKSDFEIFKKDLKELNSRYNFILAPHEISKGSIDYFENCLRKEGIPYQLKSKKKSKSIDNVLILDSIGELKYLYRLADISYVGGGFGSGLHNILEALVYGKSVLIGPNYHEFPEALEAVRNKVAFPIDKTSNLLEEIVDIIDKVGEDEVNDFISQYTGSTERILQSL